MKFITIISILCVLLSFSTPTIHAQKSTIHIELKNNNNNRNEIIIDVQNTLIVTIAVQMQDSSTTNEWIAMQHGGDGDDNDDATGFWSITSNDEFVFPLSFKLTSEENQNIILEDIINELNSHQIIDTGVQYSTPDSSHAPRSRRSSVDQSPSSSPSADQSSNVPRRKRPTTRPTAVPSWSTTTTKAPASTQTPTQTPAPTQTPTVVLTTTTTNAPTQSGGGGIVVSNNGMKLLVPLYTYPGSSWTAVAAGASSVKTVAIINPNNGPGNGPDSAYITYMNILNKAGVEMIGYVHTSYGTRSIIDVKADIDKYASEFPLVVGIFIDEAAATSTQVSYYTQVHNYIMSMPGFKYNILNPGAVPVEAYMSISTQIVSFENTVGQFTNSPNPSFASAANKDHFAVITYGATTIQMQSAITIAKNKGYYGWVYVTDGSGASTYNTLANYYTQQVTYIAAANNSN